MKKETIKKIRQYLDSDLELTRRYRRIRKEVLPIKPSQYDISRTCNLRCEGCLYFSGDYAFEYEVSLTEKQMDCFFKAEAARGVNYAHFGGAEPSLVQDRLIAAYRHIKRGVVYSNGIKRIDPSIGYRIHLSIWGNEETDHALRGAPIFDKVIRNYRGDERALFIYTISRQSIDQIEEVVKRCTDNGIMLSFNHYSPTEQYLYNLENEVENDSDFYRVSNSKDNLLLGPVELAQARGTVAEMIDRYPHTVLYHHDFNRWITNEKGVFQIDPKNGWAIDCASRIEGMMKHFAPDLTPIEDTKCCVPNIVCETCRCFSMTMATAIDRLERFAQSEEGFRKWLNIIELWSDLFFVELQQPKEEHTAIAR